MIIIVFLVLAVVIMALAPFVIPRMNRAEDIAEAEQQLADVQAELKAKQIRELADELRKSKGENN